MPPILRWFLRLAPTNPITVRLVQNGSRRIRHLYIRAGYLAALILVLLWSLLAPGSSGAMSYSQLAQAGATSFAWVAYLQVGLICVLAPVFMAGAIAQEASPRTWEVLLTTPLSALQIVLGNLSGRLFFILGLLVSSLPLFALTQYFGGVPGRSIFISYAIAGSAALLVGSIAISLSVSRLVGKRAVFAFYVAVVSYLAITIGVDAYLRASAMGVAGAGATWMTAINPFLGLRTLLNPSNYPVADATAYTGVKSWFLAFPVSTWCGGSIVLSLILVLASTFTVRLGGLATLTSAGYHSGKAPWYRRIFGFGKKGADYRPPRAVWHNPIAWREAASRNSTFGRIIARWSFVAAGGLWGLLLIILFHIGSLPANDFKLALIATILSEIAVTTLVAINMAATAVSREREDGTLDLLLTTPITPGSYLTGKMRGLIAYLIPMLAVPIGTLALAGLYVLTNGLGQGGVMIKTTVVATPITEPLVLPEAGLLAPLVIIPFMAFCVMVGLYWSLKSKGTLSSVVGTVAVAGIVSGIVGLCGWNAGMQMPYAGPSLGAVSPASLLFALVYPGEAMQDTVTNTSGLSEARLSLFIGAAILAAPLYLAIVYGIHTHMVKNFDMTVRKLAGVK
jgi:ABC-type transport system involved in multi-copper enzyme maturation permease subunit